MIVTMKTKLRSSISFILLCLLFSCSTYSQMMKDSSYFPLAVGNQWIYNSTVEAYVDTETVIDTQRVNGRLYFGLAMNSSSPVLWLRKDSNKVYLAPTLVLQPDTSDIIESMIYDFSADVKTKWSVNLGFNRSAWMDCDYNGDILLESKNDSVSTSLGTFANCVCFFHSPVCMDAGRTAEWFARGVGRVLYYQENIWGPNGFSLVKSNLVTIVVAQNQSQSVMTYHLFQNYPNPFNPTTTISFQLTEKSYVVVEIIDALGRTIETLVSSYLNSGYHSVAWNALNQSSGIYFCRIHAGNYSQTIKLALVR